jgi:hypothetical protein
LSIVCRAHKISRRRRRGAAPKERVEREGGGVPTDRYRKVFFPSFLLCVCVHTHRRRVLEEKEVRSALERAPQGVKGKKSMTSKGITPLDLCVLLTHRKVKRRRTPLEVNDVSVCGSASEHPPHRYYKGLTEVRAPSRGKSSPP